MVLDFLEKIILPLFLTLFFSKKVKHSMAQHGKWKSNCTLRWRVTLLEKNQPLLPDNDA